MSLQFHASGRPLHALLLLRLGVAVLIGAHAYSRVYHGSVGEFGVYLSSQGMPFGTALAWCVTLTEIAGTLCLASGRWIRYAVLAHTCIITAGIEMVHAREGWFVVGGGRNGVEFSLSLLLALFAIWLLSPQPLPSSPSKARMRGQ